MRKSRPCAHDPGSPIRTPPIRHHLAAGAPRLPDRPAKAGHRRMVEVISPKAPRMAARLIDEVFDALDEQTVVVPGTGALDVAVPSLARSLAAVHEQHRAVEAQINALLEEHPLSQVLTSMPGPRSGPPRFRW